MRFEEKWMAVAFALEQFVPIERVPAFRASRIDEAAKRIIAKWTDKLVACERARCPRRPRIGRHAGIIERRRGESK